MKSIKATRNIKNQKRNKNYYLFNNIDLFNVSIINLMNQIKINF
jgi:hypothetical protein